MKLLHRKGHFVFQEIVLFMLFAILRPGEDAKMFVTEIDSKLQSSAGIRDQNDVWESL
jgi:hypothetical protein